MTHAYIGLCVGRKVLSRAFRSRFLELRVSDLPPSELVTILERRCNIAPSHAARLVAAMQELQRRRTQSRVFSGRHGLITARDLFRWAQREALGYADLAVNGYLLLASQLRTPEERAMVQTVRVCKVGGVRCIQGCSHMVLQAAIPGQRVQIDNCVLIVPLTSSPCGVAAGAGEGDEGEA